MSSLAQYEKHFFRSGPELVLETAARDAGVTDAEYLKLWSIVHPEGPTRGRRGGKSHALKMRDRDFARTHNG